MTVAQLLAELREKGVILTTVGDRLCVDAPKGAVTDELREAIRRHKLEIIELLQSKTVQEMNGSWSRECLEAERRFGSFESKLYPLLGGEVEIPGGRGVLWQVLSSKRVGVVVIGENGEKQVRFFEAAAIRPVS